MDYSNTISSNMFFNPSTYTNMYLTGLPYTQFGYNDNQSSFPSWSMNGQQNNPSMTGTNKTNVSSKALSETNAAKVAVQNLVYDGKKEITDNWDLKGQLIGAGVFSGLSGVYNPLVFREDFGSIIRNAEQLAGRNEYLYQIKNSNLLSHIDYRKKFQALRSFGNAITKLERNLKAIGVLDASGNTIANASNLSKYQKQVDALKLAKREMSTLINAGTTINPNQLQNITTATSDLNKAKGSIKRVSRPWRFLKGEYQPTTLKTGYEGLSKATSEASKVGGISKLFKGAGPIGALIAFGMEAICEYDCVKKAFEINTEAGNKQIGKSLVKASVSGLSWAGGAAAGAAIGTMIGGPIGTVLGLGIGIAIGGLASTASKKVVKHFIGEDEWNIAKEKQEKQAITTLSNNIEEYKNLRDTLYQKAQQEQTTKGNVSDETKEALQAATELAAAAGITPIEDNNNDGDDQKNNDDKKVEYKPFNPFSREGMAAVNEGYRPVGDYGGGYGNYGYNPYMSNGGYGGGYGNYGYNPYMSNGGYGGGYGNYGYNPYMSYGGYGGGYGNYGYNPYMSYGGYGGGYGNYGYNPYMS